MDLVFRYSRATITVLWTVSLASGGIGKQRTETVIFTLYSGRKRYAILPSPPGSCMTAESYRELVSMIGEYWEESAHKYSNYVRVPMNELRYMHVLSWTKEDRPT